MKLTIIVPDNAVYKDGLSFSNLDLSQCGIPELTHALQWNEIEGHIEYRNAVKPNEQITELPQWALNCLDVWQIAYDDSQKIIQPETILNATQTIS